MGSSETAVDEAIPHHALTAWAVSLVWVLQRILQKETSLEQHYQPAGPK